VAAILSAAMMFKYSFGMPREAAAIEKAVERVLDSKETGGLELRTAYVSFEIKNSPKYLLIHIL
jgi:3-isopropylmalate dehydrogenase